MSDSDPEIEALKQNYARNREWAQRGNYATKLTPAEEQAFQGWLYKNKIPFDSHFPPDQSMQDYDMRGYWKAMMAGNAEPRDPTTLHFPDTFKTPYHKSFSAESKYALPDAPKWVGNKLIDSKGNVIYQDAAQPSEAR